MVAEDLAKDIKKALRPLEGRISSELVSVTLVFDGDRSKVEINGASADLHKDMMKLL